MSGDAPVEGGHDVTVIVRCATCGKRARYRARVADVCSRRCFDALWRSEFMARMRRGEPIPKERLTG